MQVSIDGGTFDDECTEFPVSVAVTGTGGDAEWSADITAVGPEGSVTANESGNGDGVATTYLEVCAADGAGTWSATIAAEFISTRGSAEVRPVRRATLGVTFEVSQATTETTISLVRIRSGVTRVQGNVIASHGGNNLVGGESVKIRAKKPGKSWKDYVTGTTDADGDFSLDVMQELPEGTKIKAVFIGTDAAEKSTSAISEA